MTLYTSARDQDLSGFTHVSLIWIQFEGDPPWVEGAWDGTSIAYDKAVGS